MGNSHWLLPFFMKKLIIFILISFLVLEPGFRSASLQAQSLSSWQNDLLNLDLETELAKNPSKTPFVYQYSKVYREFMRTMLSQSIDNYKKMSLEVDLMLDLAKGQKKKIKTDYDKTSLMVGALLFRAVSGGQFGEYVQSAKDLYRAYKYYLDLLLLRATHPSTKIYGGIMALLYGELPNEYYNWLAILGIRLDPDDGFRQLKEAYYATRLSGGSVHDESALILIIAMKEFADDPKAAWNFIQTEELEKHPNIILRYYSALAAFRAGHTAKAQLLIDELVDSGVAAKLPYIYYQRGRFMLFQDDPLAIEAFEMFLNLNKGDNYIKSSWQKMGWHFIMQDNNDKAGEAFRQVGISGKRFVYPDQQALREIENDPVPEKKVLRLRLLFDGGYYEKCLDECSHFENANYIGLSRGQIVEVLYRQARSHHYRGNHARAIDYYQQIVEKYSDVQSYQVPKAALQAGILLAQSGQKQEAEEMLKKCLKINDYGFQATIKREAQSALRKL